MGMSAIVTDVHYRMSLALVRDLGEAGVEVVTCERAGAGPALGGRSKYASRHASLPEEGYLDALYALCREVGEARGCKPALLPVGAATLGALARERARFDEVCGLLIPTPEQLDAFNRKEEVHRLAASLGIPVPRSFVREAGESPEAFWARVGLPCVIKPSCGEKLALGAAQRYRIAADPAGAQAAFDHFAGLAGEEPVVQEYLPGGALGCSVLAREGRILGAICHRREREYPVSGGPSTCCRCVDAPELVDWAGRMVEAAGYSGLAMLEFKEDGAGRPRLLEINPRIWGTFPLTRASGSGMGLLWCALAWNGANPGRRAAENAVAPRVGTRMIFAASDAAAAAGYLRRGQVKRALRAAVDLLDPTVRDGVFEWGDPRPAWAYLKSLRGRERA